MNFEEVIRKTMPFEEFKLKWRFTEEMYNVLSNEHLLEIKALNSEANELIGNFLFDESGLLGQYKLNEGQFKSIIELDFRTKTEKEVTKWLENLNINSDENVLLFWDSWGSAVTNWKIFKMYYDDFYYPVSDDLILTNKNTDWILYFFHEEIVYFGSRI